MTAGRPMPTQDDVLGYFNTLSNWGRWGDDDELGTLNHITDDVRLAAARAVRHGRSVSCAWELAVPEDMERSTTTCPCAADMPGAEDMPLPGFRNDRRWGFSSERLGITFHGNTLTHVDSPCHIFWDGTMYNGRSHSLVGAATGSAWAAVTAAANGIITRGVLLDCHGYRRGQRAPLIPLNRLVGYQNPSPSCRQPLDPPRESTSNKPPRHSRRSPSC